MSLRVSRREFVRLGLTRAAGASVAPLVLNGDAAAQTATPLPPAPRSQQPAPAVQVPPLGNSEPPAVIFQAYPGGTGAYLDKIRRERGSAAFDRVAMTVEPWRGPMPGNDADIAFLPLHRLAALVQSKRITSVELTRIYLDRLKRLDPVLLCAVTIMESQAKEDAQQADAEIKAGKYRGPLHGIPYGLKDLFSTKGVRTTWGSSDFENRIIDENAEIAVRLRDAGAVLIAKLATGRFGSGDVWYRGRTNNPWNLAQGSAGSSAGPASATAAGCVAFGIGTETFGSLVGPATRCGLSALRPTFGRVSRHGGMVLTWSMDKVGPLCRTVEDCALVFNEIHGTDEKDPSTVTAPFRFERRVDLAKLRIGYDESDTRAHPLVAKLRELGAKLTPMQPRPSAPRANSFGIEFAVAFEWYGPGNSVLNMKALDYLQGERRRQILMQRMAEVMADVDMYITSSGDGLLTNQTGHPVVVVQTGWGGAVEPGRAGGAAGRAGGGGDPVATPTPTLAEPAPQPTVTMIVGALFNDDKILSVAHAFQMATDWHTRKPKI